MAIKRIHFLAHGGEVQGVGFRYFARKHANQLNLTGWVKNLPNNKVEGEVQGEEDAIKTMMEKLDRGPSMAKVVRLDKEDREVIEGDSTFEVRH